MMAAWSSRDSRTRTPLSLSFYRFSISRTVLSRILQESLTGRPDRRLPPRVQPRYWPIERRFGRSGCLRLHSKVCLMDLRHIVCGQPHERWVLHRLLSLQGEALSVKKRTSRSVRRELRYFMLGIGYEDIEKLVVDFQAHCVQASVEVESVDICHA